MWTPLLAVILRGGGILSLVEGSNLKATTIPSQMTAWRGVVLAADPLLRGLT
jgi:hypothetical protein